MTVHLSNKRRASFTLSGIQRGVAFKRRYVGVTVNEACGHFRNYVDEETKGIPWPKIPVPYDTLAPTDTAPESQDNTK